MNLHTKALYNLLQLSHTQDPSLLCEEWQKEDLRKLSLDDLFSRLHELGLIVDRERFLQFANECDSPEEVADLLVEDHADAKQYDKVFLLLFECWRRLLTERPTLSVVCDELDHSIRLYEGGEAEDDRQIRECLEALSHFLQERGPSTARDKQELFAIVNEFSAYDLTGFLIDYISELLERKETVYASALIKRFEPFVQESDWFRLFKIGVLALTDSVRANQQLRVFVNVEELSFDLLSEALYLATIYGEFDTLLITAKKALSAVSTQEELQEVVALLSTIDLFRS